MDDKLTILWTNADPVTAKLMVFMYAKASMERHWWRSVQIVVWGATAKLVAEDKEIQDKIREIMDAGVEVSACLACATALGVVDTLSDLGLELKLWGGGLTDLLKGEGKLLTV
jgi:hypothetical protein